MKVEDALVAYAQAATSMGLLAEATPDIVASLQARKRDADLREAHARLGPWRAWPIARRRALARLLIRARSRAS